MCKEMGPLAHVFVEQISVVVQVSNGGAKEVLHCKALRYTLDVCVFFSKSDYCILICCEKRLIKQECDEMCMKTRVDSYNTI